MHKKCGTHKSALVLSCFIINVITIVNSKPFLNNGPLSFSIFSPQKESPPESHIAKIPLKSAKLIQETTTTEEPANSGPSFVEHKINKVFQKILTISQLANTLRASSATSENLETEQNSSENGENGYTVEDSTNPPPSFVEQKIGRIVQKLFTLSQFASNIRERLNQPNYIFEFISENNGNESQDFSPDFINYLNGKKDAEEIETSSKEEERDPKQYIPLDERKSRKGEDFEGIEALKEKAASGEESSEEDQSRESTENDSPKNSKKSNRNKTKEKEPVTIRPQSKTDKKDTNVQKENLPKQKTEKELIEEEAYRVYLFNQEEIAKSAKNIDVTKENDNSIIKVENKTSNVTDVNDISEDKTNTTESVITEKTIPTSTNLSQTSTKTDQKKNDTSTESSIKVDFPDSKKDTNEPNENMNGVLNTLKQTAEQVGYFVLEFFASFVGLTLGAVTQINHAFHQSNNTILVGIYNTTH